MRFFLSIILIIMTILFLESHALASEADAEPLYTKSAQRYRSYVIDTYIEHYKDRLFEELEEVDATELRIDMSFPVLSKGQVRLSLPFYTDGDGVKYKPGTPYHGQDSNLDGNGGTFNFASIGYEHQFMKSSSDNCNVLYFFMGT